jgi:AraC-like DNA-binding protein
MPADRVVRGNLLGLLAGSYAAAADRVMELPPGELLQEIRGFVADISSASTLHEQLLGRSLATHLLARIGVALNMDLYPDVRTAFVALAASPWAADDWVVAFARLVERLEAVLTNHNDLGSGRSTLDIRLSKAMRLIDTQYADSRLTLRRVAARSGLSFSHLAHVIKRHTGESFVAHVRRRRITAARRLLDETALTIKEIAAAVGYGSTRQFERDFKRCLGTAPKTVRAAHDDAPSHDLSQVSDCVAARRDG